MGTGVCLECKDKAFLEKLKEYICLHHHEMKLSDDKGQGEICVTIGEEEGQIPMYQKASAVYSEIMGATLAGEQGYRQLRMEGTAELVGVIAPGFTDKSGAILEMCESLTKDMKKVLYLSPDAFLTTHCPFRGKRERDFSELYHAIHHRDENLNQVMESLIGYDEIRRVYYIRNIYPTPDLSMTEEDMVFFICALKENRTYDCILLDIPPAVTSSHMTLIRACHRKVLVAWGRDPRGEEIRLLMERQGWEGLKCVDLE
ncbi:MAG: hypothetical protein R6W96_00365 [Clostridia bacterium]